MPKSLSLPLVALLMAASAFLGAESAYAAPPSGFSKETVVSGLSQPTDMAVAPDGRMFVTQKGGALAVVQNGSTVATAINIASTTQGITTGGDRGLLSIALDPNFSQNGFVYLAYTTGDSHERISRFTMSGNTIDPSSEKVLLQNPAAWSGFLNAVTIRYDATDGKLYATFGSDGLGSNSQDLSSLSGKVLRFNLDGSIPSDNPYVSVQGAQGAVWAIGFRNPWKMNIATDGTVWVGDVGENTWEEVDHVFAGNNYGWPQAEGTICSQNCSGLTGPTYEYNHNGQSSAIMGGDFYKSGNFPSPYNTAYFYGDFIQGWIGTLSFNGSGQVIATSTFDTGLGNLSAINAEPDGCLYYLVISSGTMGRYCYTGSGAGGNGGSPGGSTSSLTDHVSVSSASVPPSSTLNITTTVTAPGNMPNVIVDTEIYDKNGTKVAQHFETVSLSAGTPKALLWSATAPSTQGTYTVKVGIFSSDWSTLHLWDNAAGAFSVGAPAAPSFVVSASLPGDSFNPSTQTTLTTDVTATADVSGAIIDTEVYDSSGKQVFQNFTTANLSAGVRFEHAAPFTVPSASGRYVVKVGVFASGWSSLLVWQNSALEFFSGTPPSPPQPGKTYSIDVEVPQNGQNVSGTLEVKAVIPGLDIQSYDLWWKTGDDGTLKNLDTDPITLNFKHAWINFDPWTWMPNHQYPITFVATDLSGNVIGSATITVMH